MNSFTGDLKNHLYTRTPLNRCFLTFRENFVLLPFANDSLPSIRFRLVMENVFIDIVLQIKFRNLCVKCTFFFHIWIIKVMLTVVVIGSYAVVIPRSAVM